MEGQRGLGEEALRAGDERAGAWRAAFREWPVVGGTTLDLSIPVVAGVVVVVLLVLGLSEGPSSKSGASPTADVSISATCRCVACPCRCVHVCK